METGLKTKMKISKSLFRSFAGDSKNSFVLVHQIIPLSKDISKRKNEWLSREATNDKVRQQ